MAKSKGSGRKGENTMNWLAAVLLVAVVITGSLSMVFYSSNQQLQKDKDAASAEAEMASTLSKGQAAVQKELLRVYYLLYGMSQNFTALGLNGTEVRLQINQAIASDPCIQSMITFNSAGIVQVGEPARLHPLEGMNLSFKANIAQCLATKLPVLGDWVVPVVGDVGVAMDVPVFNQQGMFQGAVNALVNISALMSSALTPLTIGTPYTWWSMQLNGTVLYDSEGVDTGHNILGPEYAGYPQLQALAWTMVNQTAGYGKYSYTAMPSSQVVSKECFWCPIGLAGTSWRLVIAERI